MANPAGSNTLNNDNPLDAVKRALAGLSGAEGGADMLSSIVAAMGFLGAYVGADRVQIWRNEMIDGALHFVRKWEWLSGLGRQPRQVPEGFLMPYSEKPEWERQFLAGEHINSPLRELPQSDRDLLGYFDIKTIAIIPLFPDGNFWGLLSLDDCRNERILPDKEIAMLRSGGLLIADAFLRHEMAQNGRASGAAAGPAIAAQPENEPAASPAPSGGALPDSKGGIAIPGVDTEKGLALYGDDVDIYVAVLAAYVANTFEVIEKLRDVSEETLANYAVNVHGLKGISAGIGAEQVREAAFALEKKSKAGDLAGVLAGNDALLKDTEALVSAVKVWLDTKDRRHPKHKLARPDSALLARLRERCEAYDMKGIDEIMDKLESAEYENDGPLLAWLREAINASDFAAAAARLAEYAGHIEHNNRAGL